MVQEGRQGTVRILVVGLPLRLKRIKLLNSHYCPLLVVNGGYRNGLGTRGGDDDRHYDEDRND